MRLLIPLLVSALAVGCATVRPAGGPDPLVGPTWRLVAIGGGLPAGPEATVTFDADGRVFGTTGCNRFTGTYRLGTEPGPAQAGRALSLSPLGTTRMACPPPAMEQERQVLDALADVARADVQGDRLVLFGTGGDRLLVFAASAARDAETALTGTVTGAVTYLPRIALPPGAIVTVRLLDVSRADAPAETLAEAVFPTGGRQVPIPFSLGYDPAEIQPRHRYVVRAEVRDRDGRLLWTTDTMAPVLTQGAPSSGVEVRLAQVTEASGGTTALAGPTWRLVRIETGEGEAVTPEADEPYTITFGIDGRFGGQADCNHYGGGYEAEAGGGLALSQVVSTLVACLPPSAADAFFRALNGVEAYAVSGGRLRLDAGDDGALVFERDGGDSGGMPPQETGRDYAYTCESPDGPFSFRIRPGPGEVALWLPERFEGRPGGTYRVLGQVRSASGAKYQDGPVTVWTKGAGEALLVVDGQTFTACRARG